MNYSKFLTATLFSIVVLSCGSQSLSSIANGKKIDEKLVGTWTGLEKDQQIEGITKKWKMIRNADGTFSLDFAYKNGSVIKTQKETGNWWIEKGKFYEYHKESGQTDVYTYKVINENQIRFKSVIMSQDMATESYEFTDTRLTD